MRPWRPGRVTAPAAPQPAPTWIALILVVAGVAAFAGEAPGVRWFEGPLSEALAKARAEKKVVMLEAWARWCGPCRAMEKDVWSKDEVGRAIARDAVPFRAEVDRNSGAGAELGDKYAISALPQVLFLDPATGDTLERLVGALPAEKIFEAMDRAKIKAGASQSVEAAWNDPAELLSLAARLVRNEHVPDARRALERVLALDADCSKNFAADAALLLAELTGNAGETRRAMTLLEGALARCPASPAVPQIFARLVDLAPKSGDPSALDRVLRARAKASPNDPDVLRALAAFLAAGKRDLEYAETIARRAVELSPDDPPFLGTLAEVLYARGRTDEARETVDRAIKIDPHDTALRELRLKITLGR